MPEPKLSKLGSVVGAKPVCGQYNARNRGIDIRRVGDRRALGRGDRRIGVAAAIAGAGAGIADIHHIAAAAGVEKDVTLDLAAIVDGGAAAGAREKVDGAGGGRHHGAGRGIELGHLGQDVAGIVDRLDACRRRPR